MQFKTGTIVSVKHGVGQEFFADSIYVVKIPNADSLGHNVCTLITRKGMLGDKGYNFTVGRDFLFTDRQLVGIGIGFAAWARTKGK